MQNTLHKTGKASKNWYLNQTYRDKDLILRVLSMYNDLNKEAEIKNISSVYKTLADEILPQLRRARLTANYDIIGRSDDEINEAFNSDPKVLSVEELLYAATLTNDNARKEAIFTKTTQLYPNDFRAYNNLGELAFAAGDAAKAESFKQAASKNANAEVNANNLCELVKGNVAAAETYLAKLQVLTLPAKLWVTYISNKASMTELSTHSVTLRLTVPLKLRFWLKTITKQKLLCLQSRIRMQ